MCSSDLGKEQTKPELAFNKTSIENFKNRRTLFIYGTQGLGRYLDSNAKDVIRIRDTIMKFNTKYKFLYKLIPKSELRTLVECSISLATLALYPN